MKLKNKAVLNLKQYCTRCYVGLSDVFLLFRDSFYCDLSGSVEVRMFLFNNVILYYKQGIIFAAPGC